MAQILPFYIAIVPIHKVCFEEQAIQNKRQKAEGRSINMSRHLLRALSVFLKDIKKPWKAEINYSVS